MSTSCTRLNILSSRDDSNPDFSADCIQIKRSKSSTYEQTSTTNKINNDTLKKLQKKIIKQYPWLTDIKESTLITDNRQPDNPIIYANDAFERMTRYPKELIIGKNCRFLQGKLTNQNTVKLIKRAIEKGSPIEVEILNYRRDGVPFLNVFLMLPVYNTKNGEKITHFIAIQKDVTVFVQDDTKISEWTTMQLAMAVDSIGLDSCSKIILQNQITGAEIVSMREEDFFAAGVFIRKDRRQLLQFIEKKIKQTNKISSSEKAGQYSLLSSSEFGTVDSHPNAQQPRNLSFWEKEGNESDSTCVKCYFQSLIEIFCVKKTISLSKFRKMLKYKFGSSVVVRIKGTHKDISNDFDLLRALDYEGTVCLSLRLKTSELQKVHDVISLHSLPMFLVKANRLLHLNPAAVKQFPNIDLKKFSSVFKKPISILQNTINGSFLTSISIDSVTVPVQVHVSPFTAPNCYVLTIITLSLASTQDILNHLEQIESA